MPRFHNQFVTLCGADYSHLVITDRRGIYNLTVLIDNDVLDLVKYYRWSYNGKVVKSSVPLAEVITGVDLNSQTSVIFRNGDRCDYRKENLLYAKSGVPIPGLGGDELPPGITKCGDNYIYRIRYGLRNFIFKSTSLSSTLVVLIKVVIEGDIMSYNQLSNLFSRSGWHLECLECYHLAYSVLDAERKNFYLLRQKMFDAIRWHKQFGREPLVQSFNPVEFETTSNEQV